MWNGSQAQLSGFQSLTNVTFPLLIRAASGTSFGVRSSGSIDALMVVDQKGVIRQLSGSSTSSLNSAAALITQLVDGDRPLLAVTQDVVDFGETMQVGESRSATLTVQNSGTVNLVVSRIQSDLAGITFDTDSLTVAPGASRELTITLTPLEDGDLTGSVSLVTNDPDQETHLIPLQQITVKTLLPAVSLLSSDLDFGDIEIGRQASRTATVRNDGEGTLQITGVTSDLSEVSVTPAAATVLPGDTVDLVLSLTVASEGAFSGDLQISSNDPDFEVLTVFLQGNAIVVLADPRTDFNADGRVDFVDFLQFVLAYNTVSATHDLDDNGRVDFSDFLLFIKSYSRPLP
jgi:hypothetical protein